MNKVRPRLLLAFMLVLSPLQPAFAQGYGDYPDGDFSYEEMELLLWVNATRVAPGAFDSSTEGGVCSYGADRNLSPTILRPSADALALEVAEVMAELSDCSGDVVVGEDLVTVCSQLQSTRDLVVETVMCDEGARDLLRADGDLGLGVASVLSGDGGDPFFTIAVERLAEPDDDQLLRMGICERSGSCMATWHSPGGSPLERLVATDGHRELSLSYSVGRTDSGLFARESLTDNVEDDLGCDPYWFVWETEFGSGTFPEEGALSAEDCPEFWVERPFPRGWFCGTPGPVAALGSALSALLALARRRGR